ncbi:acyltransferase [Gemmatimonadetes bacterium T265]|nr:acyltransferase [Gemmatimonadetes bacterium T265]
MTVEYRGGGDARVPRLDGLRAVAILLVIAGHVGYYTFGRGRVGELGGLGVLLFFVLSGYLITGLLQREQLATGRIDLRAFYARRALRILPAFWVFMAVVCTLMLLGVVTDATWKAVLACLLFVRNWAGRGQTLSHIWTLSLEEQFYAVWPAVLVGVGTRRALGVAAGVALACAAWRGYAIARRLYPYESDVFYLRTDFRMDSILVGCCLALATARRAYRERLCAVFRALPLRLMVPALLAWVLTASVVESLLPVYLTVETLLAVAVLGRVLVGGGIDTRALEHPVMTGIGRLSYSIYLWQQPFLTRVHAGPGVVRALPAALAGIAATSLASYFCIERPALAFRARWSRVALVPGGVA